MQVCTLADLDYDVYHATIKSSDGIASQEYYARPRYGFPWDAQRAEKLAAMLEASIQRRFPRGLKVHVQSVDSFGCLAALTAVLRDAGLTITRAKVGILLLGSSSWLPGKFLATQSLRMYLLPLDRNVSEACLANATMVGQFFTWWLSMSAVSA
jgi:hypothetical protein